MFYVIEIQKHENGAYAHLVHAAETRNDAESKYHTVLAAAAISDLPAHACALLTEEGAYLKNECFHHGAEE